MLSANFDLISISNELELPNLLQDFFTRNDAELIEINSKNDLDNFFHIRHDVIHWFCSYLFNKPFRSQEKVKDVLRLNPHPNLHDVENQTPDLIIISNERSVHIIDIAVTNNVVMGRNRKISHYNLLSLVVSATFPSVRVDPIILSAVNPNFLDSVQDVRYLMTKNPDIICNYADCFLRNCNRNVNEAKKNPKYQSWIAQISDSEEITQNVLPKLFGSDIYDPPSLDLTEDEEKYLDMLASKSILKSSETIMENKTCEDFYLIHKRDSYISESKRTFPVPFVYKKIPFNGSRYDFWNLVVNKENNNRFATETQMLFHTIFTQLKQSLNSEDFVHGQRSGLCNIKLDMRSKYTLAMEGPGRNTLIRDLNSNLSSTSRSMSENLKNESKKNDTLGYDLEHHDQMLEDFLNQSSVKTSLSERFNPTIEEIKERLRLEEPFMAIEFIQELARDMCISNLKHRKNEYHFSFLKNYTIGVINFPSKKLSSHSIHYYCLVSLDYSTTNLLSGQWSEIYEGVYVSKIFSMQSYQLEYWLRCVDSSIMAYLSYVESSKISEKGIGNTIELDLRNSNFFNILCTMAIDMRRSTSTRHQNLRYLYMNLLSVMNKKPYAILCERYKDPIRSKFDRFLIQNILENLKNFKIPKNLFSIHPTDTSLHADTFILHNDDEPRISRLISRGPSMTFRQVLCEMYFHMIFNKNQTEKLNSDINIMKKMYKEELLARKVNIKDLLEPAETSQYSSVAVNIALKLLCKSEYSKSNFHEIRDLILYSRHLKKPIMDLMTLKASHSGIRRSKFNDDYKLSNKRSKCVETISKLLDETFDYSDEDITFLRFVDKIQPQESTEIQLFPKLQIGGPREILILDAKSRVLINYVESISRSICERLVMEKLTSGSDKAESMNNCFFKGYSQSKGSSLINVNINADMSTWCQRFNLNMFKLFFKPFLTEAESNFVDKIIEQHINKIVEVPKELLRLFSSDYEEGKSDIMLDQMRSELIETDSQFLRIQSGMGQGIFHYTSSLCHCLEIVLEEEVFSRSRSLISKNEKEFNIFNFVSSDDKQTFIFSQYDSKETSSLTKLYISCSKESQNCFSIKQNWFKTSITSGLREFNSLFSIGSYNYPALMKFSLQSVGVPTTDSPLEMCQDLFNRTRQMVENGGSLWLSKIAMSLNEDYINSYIPESESFNYFKDSDLRIPDFGFFDVEMNDFILTGMNSYTIHKLSKQPYLLSKLFMSYNGTDLGDGVYRCRIRAQIGMSSSLTSMRRRMIFPVEEALKLRDEDIFWDFTKSYNKRDILAKSTLKLYSYDVKNSFRSTSGCLYYGRIRSLRRNKIFYISKQDIEIEEEKYKTFEECLMEFKSFIDNQPEIIPRMNEDVIQSVLEMQPKFLIKINDGVNRSRDKFKYVKTRQTKIVRRQLNSEIFALENTPVNLMKDFITSKDTKSLERDLRVIEILRPRVLLMLNSLKNFPTKEKVTRLVNVLSSSYGNLKYYACGHNSNSQQSSAEQILKYDALPGFVSTTRIGRSRAELNDEYESLRIASNNLNILSNSSFPKTIENFNQCFNFEFCKTNPISASIIISDMAWSELKIQLNSIVIMSLYCSGEVERMKSTINQSGIKIENWIVEQRKREDGTYEQNSEFCVTIMRGSHCMNIRFDSRFVHITLNKTSPSPNLRTLFEDLLDILRKCSISVNRIKSATRDSYYYDSKRVDCLKKVNVGWKIDIDPLLTMNLDEMIKNSKLIFDDDKRVFKILWKNIQIARSYDFVYDILTTDPIKFKEKTDLTKLFSYSFIIGQYNSNPSLLNSIEKLNLLAPYIGLDSGRDEAEIKKDFLNAMENIEVENSLVNIVNQTTLDFVSSEKIQNKMTRDELEKKLEEEVFEMFNSSDSSSNQLFNDADIEEDKEFELMMVEFDSDFRNRGDEEFQEFDFDLESFVTPRVRTNFDDQGRRIISLMNRSSGTVNLEIFKILMPLFRPKCVASYTYFDKYVKILPKIGLNEDLIRMMEYIVERYRSEFIELIGEDYRENFMSLDSDNFNPFCSVIIHMIKEKREAEKKIRINKMKRF